MRFKEFVRRERTWLVVGLALAVIHVAVAGVRVSLDDSDLIAFHQTSLHWWRTGTFTQSFGVRHYLPAFVVLMAPLVAWPLPVTAVLWPVVNIALLVVAMRHCARWVAQRYGEPLPITVRWVWPLALAFPYVSGTIALGQVNVLVLALSVLAYTCGWSRRRDMLSGVLIGVAAVVKLYPLIFAVFWLAKGRWRGFVSAVGCFVALAGGLSLIGFGPQETIRAHRQWLAEIRGEAYRTPAEVARSPLPFGHLLYWPKRNQFHRENNQSLAAVIRRLTTDLGPPEGRYVPVHLVNLSVSQAYLVYVGTAGAIFAVLVVTARRRSDGPGTFPEYTGWLASPIAYVPIWWTHYFVLALPALCVLVAEVWAARRRSGRAWLATVLAGAWLAAIGCLGVKELRLVGVHCWLTIALMAWAITRKESAAVVGSGDTGSARWNAVHAGQ